MQNLRAKVVLFEIHTKSFCNEDRKRGVAGGRTDIRCRANGRRMSGNDGGCHAAIRYLLHLAHEAGADEGIKAGITLAPARLGVNGSIRLGTAELPLKTVKPHLQGGKGLLGGLFSVVRGGIRLGIGGEKDAPSLGRSRLEAVLTLQFPAYSRVLLPVTRMADGIGLGSGLVDDATLIVAVLLAAVDDAASLERAADVADRI